MPLDEVVGLGPGHIVLDGDPVGTQSPQQPLSTFGPCLLWPNSRPSQQQLSSCWTLAFTDVASWRQYEKDEHAYTATNLPLSNGINIVSVLQRLHLEIGRKKL